MKQKPGDCVTSLFRAILLATKKKKKKKKEGEKEREKERRENCYVTNMKIHVCMVRLNPSRELARSDFLSTAADKRLVASDSSTVPFASSVTWHTCIKGESLWKQMQWRQGWRGGQLNWWSVGLEILWHQWPQFKPRQEYKKNVWVFFESKMLCWLAVGVPNPRVYTYARILMMITYARWRFCSPYMSEFGELRKIQQKKGPACTWNNYDNNGRILDPLPLMEENRYIIVF